MGQISRALFLATLILVLYYVGTSLLDRLSYRRSKRLHSCQEARRYTHWEPFFGLDLLIKNDKELTKFASSMPG